MDNLNSHGIKFALSNVLKHKGKESKILKNWATANPNYKIYYLNYNYSNCNYQKTDKNASVEVLITNYETSKQTKTHLFSDEF